MSQKMFHYGAYKTCPTCGKQFFIPYLDDWAYRRYKLEGMRDRIYICSWSCLRKWDAEHEDKRRKKKKKLDWEE